MTFGSHFGSHIENMKNAYKHLFYSKIDKHQSTQKFKHQDLFLYIISSEINQNIAVVWLMHPVYHSLRHFFVIFDGHKI